MDRAKTLQLLTEHLPVLMQRFHVTDLTLFGSTARDTAREDSNIDILLAFDGIATSERYFGVLFFLKDLLGHPVDLVTDKALRPELRPYIEKEALHVQRRRRQSASSKRLAPIRRSIRQHLSNFDGWDEVENKSKLTPITVETTWMRVSNEVPAPRSWPLRIDRRNETELVRQAK